MQFTPPEEVWRCYTAPSNFKKKKPPPQARLGPIPIDFCLG
jgi:hypothetical protein